MEKHEKFSMVLTTIDKEEDAEKLAEELVRNRLAACVQISPLRSVYSWQGKINRDNEFLLRIKTLTDLYRDVEKFILETHPYDVPQVIRVPITEGFGPYLNWITENTGAQ